MTGHQPGRPVQFGIAGDDVDGGAAPHHHRGDGGIGRLETAVGLADPGIFGLQLLKEVRTDAKLKSIPFIMVTAESKTENVIAAKKAGVNNYIVKPFNAATLKTKMTAVIGEF